MLAAQEKDVEDVILVLTNVGCHYYGIIQCRQICTENYYSSLKMDQNI